MRHDQPGFRPATLAILAALGWVLGAAIFATRAWWAGFDGEFAESVHALAVTHPGAVDLAWVWHYSGSSTYLFPITVVVVVLLLLARRRGWAMWLIAVSLGGLVISETLKHTVERQRPAWGATTFFEEAGYSLPSGHAMAGIYAWCAFGIIAFYVLPGRWRHLAWPLIAFGVLMGPSRLVLSVHWPTDVLIGQCLAAAWLLTVSAVALAVRESPRARKPQPLDAPPLSG